MTTKHKQINAIANAVAEILAAPELSCLPRYNREDVVAVIAMEIIEMLSEFGVIIELVEAAALISMTYKERFGVEAYNPTLISCGNRIH